ncbi:MAG: hypothetical protein F6K06_11905 [Okeania sp. SIO1H4]|nr:hypothetical protein [Okeania sp. SIO1H4]
MSYIKVTSTPDGWHEAKNAISGTRYIFDLCKLNLLNWLSEICHEIFLTRNLRFIYGWNMHPCQ